MKQFISLVTDHLNLILDVYEPYRSQLSEEELNNLQLLVSARDTLATCRKIPEEQSRK